MGTAGASALLERIGEAYGKTGWDKPAVSWQQERLPLHDLLELIVIEVAVCSCLALARPLLEYCIQFWSPECRRDIDKLEATEQGAPRLNRAGILAMRERVMELGFFGRGGFVWTWHSIPVPLSRFLRRQVQALHRGMWQENEILVIN